jgi:hypothetical protein
MHDTVSPVAAISTHYIRLLVAYALRLVRLKTAHSLRALKIETHLAASLRDSLSATFFGTERNPKSAVLHLFGGEPPTGSLPEVTPREVRPFASFD